MSVVLYNILNDLITLLLAVTYLCCCVVCTVPPISNECEVAPCDVACGNDEVIVYDKDTNCDLCYCAENDLCEVRTLFTQQIKCRFYIVCLLHFAYKWHM